MRARRREINIFNMSLLDILCGALGAFCFMMLVALPYYIPPGSGLELRKAQDETNRLLKELGDMTTRMPDQKSVEEMEKLMRELEAQVKALQGRVNILTAEKEELTSKLNQAIADKEKWQAKAIQLAADNVLLKKAVAQAVAERDALAAANQELKAKNDGLTVANQRAALLLKRRQAFVAAVHSADFLDLALIDVPNEDKSHAASKEAVAAWLKGDRVTSALHSFLSVSGTSVELRTEMHPEMRQKVYVKMVNPTGRRGDVEVTGALFIPGQFENVLRFPKVTLSPERPWLFLGAIMIDENFTPTFKEATQKERDAESLDQSASESGPILGPPIPGAASPPPAQTTASTPPPPDSILKAGADARAKNRAVRDKFTRLVRLRPSDSGENDAEILSLTDEIIQALPPGDVMRRQAEDMRERTLQSQRRRGLESPHPSSPQGATPPPRPSRPQFSATPTLSPTP